VHFNLKIRTKMTTTRNDGKKKDILLAKDARYVTASLLEGYNSEEDFYPGIDVPLRVVSEAAGAYEYLQPRKITRRITKASSSVVTSGPREADGEHAEQDDDGEESDDDSNSDEDEIPLDDDDNDGDALRDEILLLGTGSNREE